MSENRWSRILIEVNQIGNGLIVETRYLLDGNDYSSVELDPIYVPALSEAAELVQHRVIDADTECQMARPSRPDF